MLRHQVSSVNKYDPPLDVVGARDHMTNLMYQLMQPQVLYDRSVQIYSIQMVLCITPEYKADECLGWFLDGAL